MVSAVSGGVASSRETGWVAGPPSVHAASSASATREHPNLRGSRDDTEYLLANAWGVGGCFGNEAIEAWRSALAADQSPEFRIVLQVLPPPGVACQPLQVLRMRSK